MVAKTKRKLSYMTTMHHYAWSVVCLFLILSMAGLWVHAQSLDSKVQKLESALAESKKPAPSTCKIYGDWHTESTKLITIGDRQLTIHTPKDFQKDVYYPVIMVYPGKGSTAQAAQVSFGLDSLPAIVVYPHPTLSTDGTWAWQGAPYSSKANDISFTAAALDKLQSDLCIDRTKIYAVGMSNGGGFASLLSCKLSDRFAAYAVIAGAMYAPAGDCKPPRPTPLIVVHGDQDATVPYEGSLKRRLPPIDSWVSQRAASNGCKTPVTINNGVGSVVTTWNQCSNNAVVQSIKVVGGRHAWGEVTNDTIWQFLSRISL